MLKTMKSGLNEEPHAISLRIHTTGVDDDQNIPMEITIFITTTYTWSLMTEHSHVVAIS